MRYVVVSDGGGVLEGIYWKDEITTTATMSVSVSVSRLSHRTIEKFLDLHGTTRSASEEMKLQKWKE